MKNINKIEIQGTIGSVKSLPFGDSGIKTYRFTVATNYSFKNSNSQEIIDTTWFNLSALETKAGELDWLSKGKPIHVVGRLRSIRYTDTNNVDHLLYDIVVEDILTLED